MTRREIYQAFQQEFPLESLKDMPLEKYTNLNREDSFCYWVESKTHKLGSFWGGSSYKFLIYRYNKRPAEGDPHVVSDNMYAWYTNLNKDTAEEAYQLVRDEIIKVATFARAGDFESIDELNRLGNSYKWKIAFLYSNEKLIPIYNRGLLNIVAKELGMDNVQKARTVDIQNYLMQQKGDKDLFDFYEELLVILDSKQENSFDSVKAAIIEKLENNDRFVAKKTGKSYVWIGTKDGLIGNGACHYEIVSDSYKKAGHSKDLAFVEMHHEGKNAALFKELRDVKGVKSFIWTTYGERLNDEGWNYKDKNIDELTDELIQALCDLDDVIGEKAREIILSSKSGGYSSSDEDTNETYSKQNFLDEVFVSSNDYDILENLLLRKKNLILQGAPGVGKTFAAKRLAYAIMGEKDESRVMQVQFHQNYSYEDFVMGYKPNEEGGFDLKPGKFYKFCKSAEEDREHKYFFIIDEINRGNLSKIFGELLMLIESDYRDKAIELSYKDEEFFVPSNLYIIGMMNTADRSLAMIDYALRRRFSFFEMRPGFETPQFKEEINKQHDPHLNNLIDAIINLNRVIADDDSLGTGFCIGHSYLCNLDENYDLESIVEYDIIPMLREYWFDNDERYNIEVQKLRAAL